MGTVNVSPKVARLEARVTPQQKLLIERAAGLCGRTVTDFLASSAEAAALETIRAYQVIELTAAGTDAFLEALRNAPVAGERMEADARHYLEMVDRV